MTANPAPHVPEDGLERVGIRDLRHNLSDFVKRVRAGETVVITDRGEEVARIVPNPTRPMGIMEQAIADGLVTVPKYHPGPRPEFRRAPPVQPGEPTASEILQQMRDEDPR